MKKRLFHFLSELKDRNHIFKNKNLLSNLKILKIDNYLKS